MAWCQDHAPATAAAVRLPAAPAQISAAEQQIGARWPEDLRAWCRIADGTERTSAGYVLPFYRPLPVVDIVADWHRWQGLAQLVWGDRDVGEGRAQEAGTRAGAFLPEFVPIAEDQSGAYRFVDCRAGSLYGCVGEFLKGDADAHGPTWPSVSAMLGDVADALEQNRPSAGWQPQVTDGGLVWRPAG